SLLCAARFAPPHVPLDLGAFLPRRPVFLGRVRLSARCRAVVHELSPSCPVRGRRAIASTTHITPSPHTGHRRGPSSLPPAPCLILTGSASSRRRHAHSFRSRPRLASSP